MAFVATLGHSRSTFVKFGSRRTRAARTSLPMRMHSLFGDVRWVQSGLFKSGA